MKTTIQLLEAAVRVDRAVTPYVTICSGALALSDEKSCSPPSGSRQCSPSCNKELLNIQTGRDVVVVALDEWLGSLISDSRSDYLIFDAGTERNKFAVCELTCSLNKYISPYIGADGQPRQGKRATAFSQIAHTMKLICNEEHPVFGAQVLAYAQRIGIFGYRDRQQVDDKKLPIKNMSLFTKIPGANSGIKIYDSTNSKAFLDLAPSELSAIVQVQYPAIYQW